MLKAIISGYLVVVILIAVVFFCAAAIARRAEDGADIDLDGDDDAQ